MQLLPKQEPVGLLIAVARTRMKQAMLSRLGPHRLSPPQFWVLVTLLESEGPSLGEVSERLRMDRPTASRVVGALARRRFVHLGRDPADRRRVRIATTPMANRLRGDLLALASEARKRLVAGISRIEVDALRAGLRHVIANMEEWGPADAGGPARRRRGGRA